ncbi:MAG TPA: AI-2E family transporter [Ktedonobacteraceae bacterium]|jgi:predicted PurR-regulated permease PerM|nr:AI-2E family transporter [Ktedonobacteraceae bacterium]
MDQEEFEAMYLEAKKIDRVEMEERAQEVEEMVQEAVVAMAASSEGPSQTEETPQRVEEHRQRLLGSVGQTLALAGRNILHAINTRPGDAPRLSDKRSSASIAAEYPLPQHDGEEEHATKAEEMAYNLTKWQLRRDIPLAILAWLGVLYIVFLSAQHIGRTLLIVGIAALLAYALTPAVNIFKRVMPQFLAIAVVYLIVLGGIGALLYVIIEAAVQQFTTLSGFLNVLLLPGGNGKLNDIARAVGIQPDQIESIRQQIVAQASGAAGSIVPFVTGVFGAIVDMIVVAVLSIYFLIDGKRVTIWLRGSAPLQQRGRVGFALDTLQRIVGGYIRGQILLCTLISVLVGVGMQILGVPYALLLGVLTFILEFIPILGTLVTGVICVLLALTKGWILAVIVLVYFIIVHIIEGDIVGPRVVGRSVGLHPIVALAALIAGGELFGIWGALFASPVAGVLQAFLIAVWIEWKERHRREF